MTGGEMVGWHPQLYGHVFVQAPRVRHGQENLSFFSPWGLKDSDTIEQLMLGATYGLKFENLTSKMCTA